MQIHNSRVNGYLSDMAAEMGDIQSVLAMPDDKIVQDHHIVKSFKFFPSVMAASIGKYCSISWQKKSMWLFMALRTPLSKPGNTR